MPVPLSSTPHSPANQPSQQGNQEHPAKNKAPEFPLISVITIVYNDITNLESTIVSVLEQSYDNIEYIIIDGGSDDGTVDLIKKYGDRIDYWISEKDSGISDAFNKGLKACNGAIINFLNSADSFYHKNSVATYASYFMDPTLNIVTAFAKYQNRTIPEVPIENSSPLYRKSRISHQASFIRKIVFEEIGDFSEKRVV